MKNMLAAVLGVIQGYSHESLGITSSVDDLMSDEGATNSFTRDLVLRKIEDAISLIEGSS
jgi:hypothetical protein